MVLSHGPVSLWSVSVSAFVEAKSPRPPVLINCANLISSHQSLWRAILREPGEQSLVARGTGFLVKDRLPH